MSFDFNEQLRMSHGVSANRDIARILCDNIPGSQQAQIAGVADDRNGTDWWVTLGNGNRLSVDCKVRSRDYARLTGEDDLALETWSVIGKKVGWSRDPTKRTEYILWLWQDTGRWCLIPFPMLCNVFSRCWEEWRGRFKTRQQSSGSWQSECVFVPRKTVWSEIYCRFGGDPKFIVTSWKLRTFGGGNT